MSYSPQTGLVYIPAMHVPLGYADDVNYTRHVGRWNTGVGFLAPPEGSVPGATPLERRAALAAMNKGMLVAWDPVTQKARWSIDMPWPWNGGTLATAGNLVFQGDPYGVFRARAADTGKELWQFDAQRGIMAGPVTFRAGGEQYVAVLAGYGGSMGMATATEWMRRPPPNGMLLAFKIGGKGQLAKLPPVEPRPFVSSAEKFGPAQLAEGRGAILRVLHDLPQRPGQSRPDALAGCHRCRCLALGGVRRRAGGQRDDQLQAVAHRRTSRSDPGLCRDRGRQAESCAMVRANG